MKNLTLNEQQEIYGGGFEEGREIGHAIGSTLTGALALFGAYVFFKGFIPIVWGRKINCVMRCSRLNSSVGDRPAPRGGTTRPDERKVTTI